MKNVVLIAAVFTMLFTGSAFAGKDPKFRKIKKTHNQAVEVVQGSSRSETEKQSVLGQLKKLLREAAVKRDAWDMDRLEYYEYAGVVMSKMKDLSGN